MRGGDLSRAVLVSPGDGRISVDWKRDAIAVRPRAGWRANTTYVVTLLPGIVDLRGNTRDSTTVLVFSTGSAIPATRVTGSVFDWMRAAPAPRAFIVAHPVSDSTIWSTTEADSLGRFVLPFLSPGDYLVRGIIDANRNQRLDPREGWDSVRVALRDTAALELYAAVRDTISRLITVAVMDSTTLRLTFNLPLSPDTSKRPRIEVAGPDSTPVALAQVVAWPAFTEARTRAQRARQDALDASDTSAAARARRERAREDSLNRAAARADSLARDSSQVQAPVAGRPALVVELGVELTRPLTPGTSYRVRATVAGLLGVTLVTERLFVAPRREPGGDR